MKSEKKYYCTVEATLDVLKGKWKILIMYHLTDNTLRYNSLKRLIPNITQRMLTLHLKELEADGLIQRKVNSDLTPNVEYSQTEYGQSLRHILAAMCKWGTEHIHKFELDLETVPYPAQS